MNRRQAMTSRLHITLALAFFVVACGDEGDTAQLTMPERGEQGPGTAIPNEEERASTPSTPAPSGSTGESAPVEQPTEQPATPPAAPTKKVLDVKWYGQETYYWCGPGSTRMALG